MTDEAVTDMGTEFAGIGPIGLRRVTVRNFVTQCSIGVHGYEQRAKQRIRVSLTLDIAEGRRPPPDALTSVVCYDEVLRAVRRVIDAGHVRLIETLAERVAHVCLTDARVREAVVEIEKLDVYDDVESVGVTISRRNALPPPD